MDEYIEEQEPPKSKYLKSILDTTEPDSIDDFDLFLNNVWEEISEEALALANFKSFPIFWFD